MIRLLSALRSLRNEDETMGFIGTVKAIVTDSQFVIPVIVLLVGIIRLVELH